MEKPEVQSRVVAIVAEVLCEKPEAIDLRADLNGVLGVDSLDLAEIVTLLEEEFPVALRKLDWASSGRVTVEQVTKDICQLLGLPTVQVAI